MTSSKMSPWRATVKFVSEVDKLERKVVSNEIKILYWLGSWTMNRMKWKLSKRPPQRETAKRKSVSKRWIREVEEMGVRPPWKRTGALSNLVRFKVDEFSLSMIAGPEKLNKPTDTEPLGGNTTVPQLLDRGGPANVAQKELKWKTSALGSRYQTWHPTGRRITAQYRAFPYVKNSEEEAHDKLMQRLKKEGLI